MCEEQEWRDRTSFPNLHFLSLADPWAEQFSWANSWGGTLATYVKRARKWLSLNKKNLNNK